MTGRDKFIVVGLLVIMLVVTAVAALEGTSTENEPAAFGGTYTEAVVGAPRVLDPLFAATPVDRDVGALVFSGLMRFDQHGNVVPDLAEKLAVSPDGKTWVYTIRQDARWQDGQPVVPEDVIYTVGITQDAAYGGPYAGRFEGVTVEKVGDRVVQFVLKDVYAPFPEATTMPLLPSHLLKTVPAAQLEANAFSVRPVGSGPFAFESRDEEKVVLVHSDAFYRTSPGRSRPYLDRIVLRFYPDQDAVLHALARNEVQGAGGLFAADAEHAAQIRDRAVYFFPSDEETVLLFNLDPARPTFRDRVVRQAIALAIDKPQILQLATDGHGAVADEPVAASSWAFVKDIHRYAYAPGDARGMLDAAGWIDHDGDGVRDKGGVALQFSLLVSDDPARAVTAQEIVRDVSAIGIRANLEIVPFNELVQERARNRAFEAMVLAVSAGMDPDPYSFWHSSQTKAPGLNFTGYATLAVDRALEQARRTLDEAKRTELYAQVFGQLAEDVPAVYLYFSDYVYTIDRAVRGTRVAELDDPSQRFWNVEDWYVRTQTPTR